MGGWEEAQGLRPAPSHFVRCSCGRCWRSAAGGVVLLLLPLPVAKQWRPPPRPGPSQPPTSPLPCWISHSTPHSSHPPLLPLPAPTPSRSSALASKATGFPIAKMAAKLACGTTLDMIPNDITLKTPASFEPSIDYVVTKIPRFAFEKFPGATPVLTTQMKSVGEAMAIGRTFQESFQKAMRSLETGLDGWSLPRNWKRMPMDKLVFNMRVPNPDRMVVIKQASPVWGPSRRDGGQQLPCRSFPWRRAGGLPVSSAPAAPAPAAGLGPWSPPPTPLSSPRS